MIADGIPQDQTAVTNAYITGMEKDLHLGTQQHH